MHSTATSYTTAPHTVSATALAARTIRATTVSWSESRVAPSQSRPTCVTSAPTTRTWSTPRTGRGGSGEAKDVQLPAGSRLSLRGGVAYHQEGADDHQASTPCQARQGGAP